MEKEQITNLHKRSQFEMLGFFHDTDKLIYAEDISMLKSRPKLPELMYHYLWNDINLTKDSSFPERSFKMKDVEFILRTARCNGVKVSIVEKKY